jgi:hypothetical protein
MVIPKRNTSTNGSKEILFPMAGPGQSPERPHPTPKSADPPTSFASIIPFFCQEKCQVSAKNGVFLLERNQCQKIDTASAPIITNRSEASQCPNISRNPRTLSGDVIPDSASPIPKRIPAASDVTRGVYFIITL